jgi:hypothetical protein
MAGIGILSSIDYNHDMSRHFEAGFTSVTPLLPAIDHPQVEIGYDPGLLRTAIFKLANADLIVTFGGFVSCKAAIDNSKKQFISLVGGSPQVTLNVSPGPGLLFKGCCNLQSSSQDQIRIDWLLDPANRGHFPNGQPSQPSDIGLLFNHNSKMMQDEIKRWPGGQTVAAVFGWNNPSDFDKDFSQFGSGIKAIVVSADPYFSLNRDDFIDAANKSKKHICYPLGSHRNVNGHFQPTPGNAVLIGPFHAAAPAPIHHQNPYYRMGVMAATVLGPGNPVPAIELVAQAAASPL